MEHNQYIHIISVKIDKTWNDLNIVDKDDKTWNDLNIVDQDD